ncbi:MAG: hypothetical protein JWO67_6186 [Streptosporangiaceae bacterium]|jgi:hypothetical protein|nr:hypothetical protein [Streptosporangiaceae bacterium]
MPPPPPRRSSNTGALIAILGGGGVLAIVMIVAILAVTGVFSGGGKSGGGSPADKLAAAAGQLEGLPAVGLKGTLGWGSDKVDGELKVTRSGWASGTVTWGGQNAELITVKDQTYAKAGPGFWRSQGNVSGSPAWANDSRWGRLGNFTLAPAIKKDMTPSALAKNLRDITRYSIRSTEQSSAQGTPALKITTSGGTYFLSADGSPRLLRLETHYPGTAADVTELTGGGQGDAVTELRGRIGELKDAFDQARDPSVFKFSWGSCTASGCTVKSKVWAGRGTSSSVRVTVFVELRAGGPSGTKLGECSNSGSVTSNSIEVSCRVESAAWSRFRGSPGTRRWWGRSKAMAGAVTPEEIRAMLNDLTNA